MFTSSLRNTAILFILCFCVIFSPPLLWGQEKAKGPPPASVSVAEVKSGMVAPQSEFIATIFYQEISETASETNGLALDVRFEEGQRVKQGQVLVELGSEILRKRLQAVRSGYEQALSELEIAKN